MGTKTIWGTADQSEKIARGIMLYMTPSHGGYAVTARVAATMHPALRSCGESRDGRYWFEEDCAWSAVVCQWPELFTTIRGAGTVEAAKRTLRSWFPDEYEAFYGEKVKVEDSIVLQGRAFAAATRNQFVVQTAWGDWHEKVPKGQVGVLAKRAADGAVTHRLVPEAEYKPPMVVDAYPGWEAHV